MVLSVTSDFLICKGLSVVYNGHTECLCHKSIMKFNHYVKAFKCKKCNEYYIHYAVLKNK